MRQYTQSATIGGDIVMADDWNDEIGTIVAEINGQLDANQMPLERVTDTKLKPATYEERYSSTIPVNSEAWSEKHTYQQSQNYHTTIHCGAVNEGYNQWDEWSSTEWKTGWIKLSEKRFTNSTIGAIEYYPGAEMTFEVYEGMLVGEAQADIEWRTSYELWQKLPSSYEEWIKNDNYIELGVFVNDVCCGRTDEQWQGGRFTYVVPYSTPVGSGPITVDIRFRMVFNNSVDPNLKSNGYNMVDDHEESLYVWDSKLWARNQIR
jgi:hypothetical protein